MSLFPQIEDPAPSISVHPPPTASELVAIMAAISLCLHGHQGRNEDRIMVPTPSRWAEAGRREAMPANGPLLPSRECEWRSGS